MEALVALGIKARVLNSDQTKSQKDEVYLDLRLMTPTITMLFVTPELVRLDFFKDILLRLYDRNKLKLIVIDEVSFGPNYQIPKPH